MTSEQNNAAVEVKAEVKAEEKKAPKKPMAKKAPTKKAPKKAPAKKAAKGKKAEKKATGKGQPKKEGLRAPQERILKCLAKSGKPLPRSVIAEKAPVDQASCVEYLGSHDDDKRKANDVKHFPSLVTLGLVKHEMQDIEGRDTVVYAITAKGKAAVGKL